MTGTSSSTGTEIWPPASLGLMVLDWICGLVFKVAIALAVLVGTAGALAKALQAWDPWHEDHEWLRRPAVETTDAARPSVDTGAMFSASGPASTGPK